MIIMIVIMTIMITIIIMITMMIKTMIIIIIILLCDYKVIDTNLTRCYMVFIKSMHHDRPNITYLLSPNPGIFLGDIHHSLTGVWKLGLCHKHFMSSWVKFCSHYFCSNFDFKNPNRSHFLHMPRQLSCRGMCEIVTCLDHYLSSKINIYFYEIRLWAHKPLVRWIPEHAGKSVFLSTAIYHSFPVCQGVPSFKSWTITLNGNTLINDNHNNNHYWSNADLWWVEIFPQEWT